jgi:hypothetical protein
VLGSPAELRVSGEPHNFTNRKHLALLAYLAMEPGEHGREQLSRFVWSSGAAGSIDTAVSELRAAFGPGVVPHRAQKISLSHDLVDVDALRLLFADGDAESRGPAIELYRGPFLEDFNARGSAQSFVRWIEKTRGRLDMAFRQLCDQECQAAAAEGDWQRVIKVAEFGMRKSPDWAAGERWRESANQAVRSAYAQAQGSEPPRIIEDIQEDEAPAAQEIGSDGAAVPSALSSPRFKHPVVAGLGAVLMIVLGVGIAILGHPETETLVQMPLVRVEELPAPASPIRALSDWVRTDGRWIYYRYERYLPAACRHGTVAVGNFGPNGWTRGVPVACLNAAWLAVDGQRLIERFSLAPETTYCLQFLYIEDGTSFWGQHGAEGAPGLDSIRVVAPSGAYNIGIAITRDAPGQRRVELTHRYPGARC